MKESVFLNIKQKGLQPIVPTSPNHLLVVLFKENKISGGIEIFQLYVALTYFCSSHITEKRNKILKKG